MKVFLTVGALVFLVGIALAFWWTEPELPNEEAFGEVALPAALAPLEAPSGDLVLDGRVRTADGAPAADALVTLVREGAEPENAVPIRGTYTDEQGAFELQRLAAGRYRAFLSHPSAPPVELAVELPVEAAVTWDLPPPVAPIPTLPEIRRGPLHGTLLPPPGLAEGRAPLSGFEVLVRPSPSTPALSSACERRTTSGDDGSFGFDDLVLASYELEVLPPWARGGSWPVLARGSVEVRGDGAPVVLVLEVGEQQIWPATVTDPAGRFLVDDLPPGRYLIHLRAGSSSRELELEVRAGERASAVLEPLDPRAGPPRTGG